MRDYKQLKKKFSLTSIVSDFWSYSTKNRICSNCQLHFQLTHHLGRPVHFRIWKQKLLGSWRNKIIKAYFWEFLSPVGKLLTGKGLFKELECAISWSIGLTISKVLEIVPGSLGQSVSRFHSEGTTQRGLPRPLFIIGRTFPIGISSYKARLVFWNSWRSFHIWWTSRLFSHLNSNCCFGDLQMNGQSTSFYCKTGLTVQPRVTKGASLSPWLKNFFGML